MKKELEERLKEARKINKKLKAEGKLLNPTKDWSKDSEESLCKALSSPSKSKVEDWMKIYSAKYILEDLRSERGMEKLSELTGLPMGVITNAFGNIFDGYGE